ncbi:MAG: acyltransferase family protein, partial [Lepagella sp.]
DSRLRPLRPKKFKERALKANQALYYCLEPWMICGVNLFFLISGWFGIRLSLRSLVKLVVTTAFFIAVSLLTLFLFGADIPAGAFTNLFFFPVSRGRFWFIMVYMALMLVAPLLNEGIRHLPLRSLSILVLTLFLFSCYGCWYGNNYVSFNGYTIMQAIFLYVLAAWLRLISGRLERVPRYVWLASFVGLIALDCVIGYFTRFSELFDYNAPLVVLASVSLFLYFSRICFRNGVVNAIAKASFGCYLLQDGYAGRQLLYPAIRRLYLHLFDIYATPTAVILTTLAIIASVIAIWIASILLTPIANRLATQFATIAERLWRRLGY